MLTEKEKQEIEETVIKIKSIQNLEEFEEMDRKARKGNCGYSLRIHLALQNKEKELNKSK